MKVFNAASLCLLCIVLAAGCSSVTFDTIKIPVGEREFILELAITQEQQRQGLMKRNSMPENRGMLFVYDYDKKMSFWMKNTKIPLSIGYISADGILKEIYDMEPMDTKSIVSKYSVRYALELNRGAYKELGLSPGDRIFDRSELERLIKRQ